MIAAVPWWSISYALAAIMALVIGQYVPFIVGVDVGPHAPPALSMIAQGLRHLGASLTLMILFMLRDLLVLLWLSSSPWRAKADVLGIIYLALVYWPLAAIFWVTGAGGLLPVVAPIATGVAAVDFVPIAIELVFAAFLFYARWREITRLRRP
jgi:hypothetical protein